MRCPACGHANDSGAAFCAACYRNLPVLGAPRPAAAAAPAAPAPDRFASVPGVVWGLAWVGVSVFLLLFAFVLEGALSSLRSTADGAGLRQEAEFLFPVAAFSLLLGAGGAALLFQRPRGPAVAAACGGVGLAVGVLVAWSVADAADSLARTPLHEGHVVTNAFTLASPVAFLLAVAGGVILGVAKDRATAFAAAATAGLVASGVALVGAGFWLLDHAAALQSAAAQRERSYDAPFPGLLVLVATVALAALLARRRSRG